LNAIESCPDSSDSSDEVESPPSLIDP